MSIVDSFNTIDSKRNHETIIAKPDHNDHFPIPKISSSLSFNNLAKVKTRKRTRSPHAQEKSQDLSLQYQYPASQQITSKYKQPTNAPKVSKKLPPAFGTIFQKSSSKLVAKKPSFEVSKDMAEPLQAIEQLVGMQEYKHTVGLLSPLKTKNTRNSQVGEELVPKPVNKKTENKRHKNPLLPLKNYLLLTKYSEDKKDLSNISVDRLERLYKASKDVVSATKKEAILQRELKSNEMITLSVIRSSHETGTVKKVLHAPTMRLFAVKEVPLSNRETRINLKEWLSIWQNNFENSKNHIKIHSTSFNSPEGCISIFMELLNGGSLQNLLESVGNIPETCIRNVASQVLNALDDLHTKANTVYGALSPSQILIDKDGSIKLSLGLANRIQNSNGNMSTLSRNFAEKTALYELTPINNPGSYQKHLAGFNGDRSLMFSQDVFEFGYLMLLCAVGGLDFYETNEFADKLKLFFEELNKKPQERSKYCCVIHNEEIISSIKNFEESLFTNKPVRVQKGNNNNNIIIDNKASKNNSSQINIHDFLTQNFSKEFVKFLCSCLKFDPNERPTIKSLLSSPFVKSQETRGPAVTLPELLKISIQWNKGLVLPLEYQGPSERQLQKVCEALAVVLPNCEAFTRGNHLYENLRELTVSSPVIQNLSYELGLPAVKVWEEISKLLDGLMEEYS